MDLLLKEKLLDKRKRDNKLRLIAIIVEFNFFVSYGSFFQNFDDLGFFCPSSHCGNFDRCLYGMVCRSFLLKDNSRYSCRDWY